MNSLDWKEIEIVSRGKRLKGRYNVSESLVTVAAWNGTNTAPLGIFRRTIGQNVAARTGCRRDEIRAEPSLVTPGSPMPAPEMRQWRASPQKSLVRIPVLSN